MLSCRIVAAIAFLLCVVPSVGFAQLTTIVRAGSGRSEITPPPGYSTGGHGAAGSTPKGYWRPLTATALYFEDSAGRGAALLSVDLFGVPSAIHQDIAREFARRRMGTRLPLERIVVAATHTHHGTANYLSVTAHNNHASNERGYDPRLRTFLLQRLLAAIDAAIADADAHATFTVDMVTGLLPPDLLRNRAPAVFMKNADSAAMLMAYGAGIPSSGQDCLTKRQPGEPRNNWKVDGCPRLRAVDRGVSLLRIRRGDLTAAMAVFVSVHPTVLPASLRLFSADVFGVVRDELEHSDDGPIRHVAFFNGAEGDVHMRRTTRDAVDLITLGEKFAAVLRTVHDSGPRREIGAAEGIEGRLHFAAPGDTVGTGAAAARLASTALGGRDGVRGGEGDPSAWLGQFLSMCVPRTRSAEGEHGVKVPALGCFLTTLLLPETEFPTKLPMSIVSLGDLRLAVVPFEMNTSVGYTIRKTLGGQRGWLEIIGLANEYGSYTASTDEYQMQDYAGASTLWGPQQAPFIVESLRLLSSAAAGSTGIPPADTPGKTKTHFGPQRLGADRGNIFDGVERLFGARRPPAFCWVETAPPDLPLQAGRSIEIWDKTGTLADDRGFVVVLLGKPVRGTGRWAAIWMAPLTSASLPGEFRFRVQPERGQGPFFSSYFTADSQFAECAPQRQ